MTHLIGDILISLFFVFGVYSATGQVKSLARRFMRRRFPIDKRDSCGYNINDVTSE